MTKSKRNPQRQLSGHFLQRTFLPALVLPTFDQSLISVRKMAKITNEILAKHNFYFKKAFYSKRY